MKSKYAGVVLAVLSAVCWSFTGVLGKAVSWNSFSIMGFRSVVAAIILGFARGGVKVSFTKGNLLGAAGVMLTSFLYVSALRLTSAANAVVLQYAMSVFVILFSWLFYKQRPSRWDVIISAFVMLGVVLCSVEGMKMGNILGDALALLSAVTFATVFFCARMPGATSKDYTFLGNLMGSLFLISLFFDPNVGQDPLDLLYMVLIGCCQGFGYFFFNKAVTKISPLATALTTNLEPVLNPIWVFIFLSEFPGWLSFLGAAVVLGSVMIYSIRGANK